MIQALVNLINEPEPDHPLRGDLAEEYSKDKKKFMKNAGKRSSSNGSSYLLLQQTAPPCQIKIMVVHDRRFFFVTNKFHEVLAI